VTPTAIRMQRRRSFQPPARDRARLNWGARFARPSTVGRPWAASVPKKQTPIGVTANPWVGIAGRRDKDLEYSQPAQWVT